MNVIKVSRVPVDKRALLKGWALPEHAPLLIKEPCVLELDGKPVVVYDMLPEQSEAAGNFSELRKAVRTIRYDSGKRTRGLASSSRIFGYRPRNPLRQDFCSITSLALQNPQEHAVVARWGQAVAKVYEKYSPARFAEHKRIVEDRVLPGWRMPGTPFTSGIINKNNPLKYHHDKGNFQGCWSNMICLCSGVAGGELVVPELGVRFEIIDRSLLLFDGQSLLHGVSPIIRMNSDAYRHTIVYYSLQQMGACLPLSEELERIRRVKMEREIKRVRL